MTRSPDLLDLSVILTPPPTEAPPGTIASITLGCELLGSDHAGDFLTDPLTAEKWKDLRWYLEQYWDQFYKMGSSDRGNRVENFLPELGKELYRQVFGSEEASKIMSQWLLRPAKQHQISIISDLPDVLNLPWELLHDDDFLALRHGFSLVRRLPQSTITATKVPFELPLRVLLVSPRPQNLGFIDPRIIARELLDELQEQVQAGKIVVEFLRPPTLNALSDRLENNKLPQIHVLHFDGHGEYDWNSKLGILYFEKKNGQRDPVTSQKIAQILRNSGVLLVVMTSCQSAVGAEDNIFSNLTTRLIECDIHAVVGMSANVLVSSAACYVEAFYRALVDDPSGLNAHWRACRALYTDRDRYLLRRRRGQEGVYLELDDWWVPHYYQRRPFRLQPQKPIHAEPGRNQDLADRVSGHIPDEPRFGFSGRSRELLQLERYLMQKKLVVVHGFSGVGKTALVCEAIDWLTRTDMYAMAYYISFELDGNAALVTLEKIKEEAEKKATDMRPFLVVVDSLECILPDGEYPLESSDRTKLWDILLNLADKGAGVLLTSSDITVGDGRLEPGEKVVHLLLGGLRESDAYALATLLLRGLKDHKQTLYEELIDLLTYLDYHPLAIQFVLPMLREKSPSEVKLDLATLLPRCIDKTKKGRHRSPIDLLGTSLRRLNDVVQAMLHRLAIFEGGASRNALLVITGIDEPVWYALQKSLEDVELLLTKQIHEDIDTPFLHFHPMLTPYLRGQPGAEDNKALYERYTQYYYELARDLHHEDKCDQEDVQALVRLELPNMKHALEMLLNAGRQDDAAEMIKAMCCFLEKFGRMWEFNALQQRVAASVTNED